MSKKRNKINKVILFIITICMIFTTIFSALNVYAADKSSSKTSINISAEASTYGNIYYQIIKNGKELNKEVHITISDANSGDIIFDGKTQNNGIIKVYDVKFGNYIIFINLDGKTYNYNFTIDSEYLYTQNDLKKIDINDLMKVNKNDKAGDVKTGDENHICIWMFICIFESLLIIIYLIYKMIIERKEINNISKKSNKNNN